MEEQATADESTISALLWDRASLRRLVLRLAERIFAAHEVIGRKAERREWVLTERDYPLE